MGTKVIPPRKSTARVTQAIRLLELLSSVEGNIVTSQEAKRHLGCTDEDLDEYLALISTLADRESGARARAFRDHDDIVLEGDAAHLMPIRLTPGESAVLSYLLEELVMDDEVRDRVARALLPPEWSARDARHFYTDAAWGPWFTVLSRAIDRHQRCLIRYRAQDDATDADREVVPLRLATQDGISYLEARNLAKDEVHRYRIDRISQVTAVGDEMAVPPSEDDEALPSPANTLRAQGTRVELELDLDELPSWAGIVGATRDGDAHPWHLTVMASSRYWLFDQILSYGGKMRLVSPHAWVEDLASYAAGLLSC